MTARLCAAFVSLASFASIAAAENWPQFRGPAGQGISAATGLPTKWSPTENIAWKTEIPGLGWSSPIVWAGRIFLTTATDNGSSCHILCLDAKTGKILWDKEVFKQPTKRKEGKNSYATPTPVTDGQRIYAAFADGSLVALDLDGAIVWTNRDVAYYSQHGLAVSPILYDDLLVMPYDASSEDGDKRVGWQKPWDKSFVRALDKATGKERWRTGRGISRIGHVTPSIIKVDGRDQLISAAGDVVQGYDLKTGELFWTARNEGEGVVPSVVLGDGVVYTASGFEQKTLRAFRPGGKGDVTKAALVWELKGQSPAMSSFIYTSKLLFTVKETGIAQCHDPQTGAVIWTQRLGGTHSASPIASEGRLYFLSEDGEGTIIDAAREFKVLAKNRLEGKFQASYAVFGKQLLVRSDKVVYCVGQ